MRSKKRRFSVFTFLLFVINLLAVLLLLSSYLFSFVNPGKFWPASIFGLAYPYLLLTNIVFILIWILYRRWYFLISLIAILAGWNFLNRNLTFNERSTLENPERYLKVMSFNVKNLANDNVYLEKADVRQRIFNFIRDEKCDIVCLQEFMATGSEPEAMLEELKDHASFLNYSYTGYVKNQAKRLDALVIYSRYPIISSGGIEKDEGHNFGCFSDIVVNEDTIRIFNVHFESYRFGQDDYEFLSGIEIESTGESFKEGSRKVLAKLRNAFEKRSEQVNMLNDYVKASSQPVIVCGDFNDTPVSYTYFRSNRHLNDAFVESGRGFGNTYAGRLPSYRIDYILYSEEFSSYNYQTYRIELSDHYPVSCFLLLD